MTTMTPSPRPPALLSPAFFADPYPTYHSLRAADPVMWDETLRSWIRSSKEQDGPPLSAPRCPRREGDL